MILFFLLVSFVKPENSKIRVQCTRRSSQLKEKISQSLVYRPYSTMINSYQYSFVNEVHKINL